MSKSFWEYLTTPRKHTRDTSDCEPLTSKRHMCDVADCEPHKYFVKRFEECINKVDKMDLHSCDSMREACASLAERLTRQTVWTLDLQERIQALEKELK